MILLKKKNRTLNCKFNSHYYPFFQVVLAILVLIHWNACLYFAISYAQGFGSDNWVYNLNGNFFCHFSSLYLKIKKKIPSIFFFSRHTKCLVDATVHIQFLLVDPNIDDDRWNANAWERNGVLICCCWLPRWRANICHYRRKHRWVIQPCDTSCQYFQSFFLYNLIGSMISNMNVARVEFQNRMDGVKQYMAFRKVGGELEARVSFYIYDASFPSSFQQKKKNLSWNFFLLLWLICWHFVAWKKIKEKSFVPRGNCWKFKIEINEQFGEWEIYCYTEREKSLLSFLKERWEKCEEKKKKQIKQQQEIPMRFMCVILYWDRYEGLRECP